VICDCETVYYLPALTNLDLMWKVGWYFSDEPRPIWSGFMQNIVLDEHPHLLTFIFCQ